MLEPSEVTVNGLGFQSELDGNSRMAELDGQSPVGGAIVELDAGPATAVASTSMLRNQVHR
jgi:hypothetical protein